MSTTLYRKYRPRILDELVGQDHVKITLKQEIASGRLAHAYLFTGPRGVGKTTTARLIASAVNVPEGSKKKEDQARAESILSGNSLDVVEIDAASNRGIDDIRALREGVLIAPSHLRFKVYIIDEVHMLTTEAFNALLKTLEEPPEHAIFVLATTEVQKLPQTIVSRCERFDFHRVSIEHLFERLTDLAGREKVTVEAEVMRAIAIAAEGSMRDAESVLGQILALGEKNITRDIAALVLPHSDLARLLQLFGHLVHNETASAVQLLRETIEQGTNVSYFTKSLVQFLRGVLLRKVDASLQHDALLGLTKTQQEELDHILDVVTPQYLVHILDAFLAAAKDIDATYVPELPLEMAIVELTTATEGTQSMELPAARDAKAPAAVSAPAQSTNPKKQSTQKAKDADVSKKKARGAVSAAILQQWNALVDRIQKENTGLALILNVVHPIGVEGDTLTLACRYRFHAERLAEPSVQTYLQNIIEEVTGERYTIVTDIQDDMPAGEKTAAPSKAAPAAAPEKKPESTGDLWKDVVGTFGDDIVQED
ncbi:MAG: DNA polymerase III subunit gamma/tau [Patescibacteria group bacterium]|jgi:DNA polymerase-3 subunit gamma/tau